MQIPEQYLSGVEIVRRIDCCEERFQNIEIRAGMDGIPCGFKGRLTINEEVAFFAGSASAPGENIKIFFDRRVRPKYITIQRIGEGVPLEINEVIMITSRAKSSSVLNDNDIYAADYAIDGRKSETHGHLGHFFHSK